MTKYHGTTVRQAINPKPFSIKYQNVYTYQTDTQIIQADDRYHAIALFVLYKNMDSYKILGVTNG